VSDTKLEKRSTNALKEKGQYALAFVVVAAMLVVTNIPVFVIFFFGIFAYFVVKMLSSSSGNETREIFEFYLAANDILRDDDRRWYGFEIKEAIDRGEAILHRMSSAPPLVRFTLGALYNKFGDHKAAVNHLSQVVENPHADELAYVYPTQELRSYVKILRKIEREPADAPLTSAAVRALERARRTRGKALLEQSRTEFANAEPRILLDEAKANQTFEQEFPETTPTAATEPKNDRVTEPPPTTIAQAFASGAHQNGSAKKKRGKMSKEEEYADRKPISEVLHDIYDGNPS
jgi:hypothetical protein